MVSVNMHSHNIGNILNSDFLATTAAVVVFLFINSSATVYYAGKSIWSTMSVKRLLFMSHTSDTIG